MAVTNTGRHNREMVAAAAGYNTSTVLGCLSLHIWQRTDVGTIMYKIMRNSYRSLIWICCETTKRSCQISMVRTKLHVDTPSFAYPIMHYRIYIPGEPEPQSLKHVPCLQVALLIWKKKKYYKNGKFENLLKSSSQFFWLRIALHFIEVLPARSPLVDDFWPSKTVFSGDNLAAISLFKV